MRARITRALIAAIVATTLLLAATAPLGQPGPTRSTTLVSGD
ncbi:MAG: hypothetical protein OHK0015_32200 [Chloroflexi bacterium OHK40]